MEATGRQPKQPAQPSPALTSVGVIYLGFYIFPLVGASPTSTLRPRDGKTRLVAQNSLPTPSRIRRRHGVERGAHVYIQRRVISARGIRAPHGDARRRASHLSGAVDLGAGGSTLIPPRPPRPRRTKPYTSRWRDRTARNVSDVARTRVETAKEVARGVGSDGRARGGGRGGGGDGGDESDRGDPRLVSGTPRWMETRARGRVLHARLLGRPRETRDDSARWMERWGRGEAARTRE